MNTYSVGRTRLIVIPLIERYIFVRLPGRQQTFRRCQEWPDTRAQSATYPALITLIKWGIIVIRIFFFHCNLFVYHRAVTWVHLFVFLGVEPPLHTAILITCYAPCLNRRFSLSLTKNIFNAQFWGGIKLNQRKFNEQFSRKILKKCNQLRIREVIR